MTDEEIVEETETEEEVEEVVAEEGTEEVKARTQGWVSQAEWTEAGNSADDWVDARYFNERGELYRKISNLSKKQKQTEQTLRDVSEHHKKVAELERDKLLGELKRQKTDALENSDFNRVTEIDDEMATIRSEPLPEVETPDPATEVEEAAKDWISRNPWYETDAELQKKASILMTGYRSLNPQAGLEEVFDYASREIKKMNPQKFRPKANNTPTVGGSERTTGTKPSTKKTPSFKDLDYDHQKIAKNFEGMGIPIEKTIKEWVETGEIEWR